MNLVNVWSTESFTRLLFNELTDMLNDYCIFFFLLRAFQTFEAPQLPDPNVGTYGNANFGSSYYDPNAYAAPDPVYDGTANDFDNEPPLLEGKFI